MDELIVEPGDRPGVLRLAGDLDLATAKVLDAAIDGLRADGHADIVLDTRDLEFIDSSGLASLLRAAQSGEVCLRDPSTRLSRLLELAGLSTRFPVVD